MENCIKEYTATGVWKAIKFEDRYCKVRYVLIFHMHVLSSDTGLVICLRYDYWVATLEKVDKDGKNYITYKLQKMYKAML